MCGIAGFLGGSNTHAAETLRERAERMADALRHRGPDSGGAWADPAAGIALGHRRLAIVDLSPLGHQPMASATGRFVLSFNGEIYNFNDIAMTLRRRGHAFRGTSDTEVMLAAFEEWGVAEALTRFNGMFAFALWDCAERTLTLGRDRLGEKPLYYGRFGATFLFGSELKALRAHPDFRGEVDRGALTLFLRYGCVPAPYSIYRGVRTLPPATFLTLRQNEDGSGIEGDDAEPMAYWSARTAAECGARNPFEGTTEDATEEMDRLLRDAVRMRMVSDVPLGAFLSGGIDSSTVVALMQAQSGHPTRTFTIGFEESGYSEAEQASRIALHLGTEHTTLTVTPQEARSVIPCLPTLYDEPFADASQIPTYLVCKMARRHVTVGLSGDGGDELFGGYNRYVWTHGVGKRLGGLPRPVRRAAAAALGALSPDSWDSLSHALPERMRPRTPGEKVGKIADLLARGPNAQYLGLVSRWQNPTELVSGMDGQFEPPTRQTQVDILPMPHADSVSGMMLMDTQTYLPDDVLVKTDRASMGVALEARVPLLDHRIVEFAWRLPLSMKIRGGQGKWLLRQVLERYVPPALTERPKMGFALPIGNWLRGPELRPWAEELLSPRRLAEDGFLNARPIRSAWNDHLSGRKNEQSRLWTILMFQAWLEDQRKYS